MDLLSESSGTAATRILSARHISLEKSTPELNTETNTTLLCNSFSVQPPFRTYLEALHPYEWVVFPTGAVLLIVLALLYAVTLKSALKHYKHGIFNIAVIVSVYPIVALCSFFVVLLPRVRVLLEAIAQESVMVSMYFFYRFIISECGGKDQMVRRSGGASLETRVLPCCCWPCCVLPRPQLKTKHVSWIGHLVLQLPIVQGIIYTVILIIWVEDFNLYVAAFPYIQPFIAASILTGVWGTIMCVRAANSAAGLQLKPKYLVLQLALLIVKLQCASIKAIPSMFTIPCVLKMHPLVLVSLILNCIIIIEMLLLSLWAYNLYKKPTGKGVDPVQQVVVAVLDESFNMDSKPRKESNGSKSS